MLYSGGADSVALWHLYGKPHGVYIRYGARYEDAELAAIEKQKSALSDLAVSVFDGPQIGYLEQVGGRIPARNLLLITTAVAVMDSSKVLVGFLKGEASPDKSAQFVKATSRALSESEGRPIQVWAPALNMTKAQMLMKLRQRFPNAPLRLAYSCYSGLEVPCGQCQACFRGDVAQYLSGWSDQLPALPTERASALQALRKAGVRRWGGLLANNLDAVRALRGRR